jgi:DNA-binding transcriptional LysR family regulator
MSRPVIELRQLYVFSVVAEELHFGRAAARLGISQPPLSQQIKTLEALVGHTLLLRGTRSVQLTEAGASLLACARKLLDDAAQGLEKARQAGKGEAGTLNLGFTATTALHMLPRIFERLRQNLPDINVSLFELLPDPLCEALEDERIDVAIAREMINVNQFDVVPLYQEPYVAVLPATHPHAHATGKLRLDVLSDDGFVLFPRNQRSRNIDQVVAMCRNAGFTPRLLQEAPGWQTAVSFVGSGLGVTLLPECVRSFMMPDVIYRPVETDVTSTIMLMRRRQDTRRIVENFWTVARAAIAAPA